jgi:hypothetical protein
MLSPVKFEARASEASAVDTEAWVAAAALAPTNSLPLSKSAAGTRATTSTSLRPTASVSPGLSAGAPRAEHASLPTSAPSLE